MRVALLILVISSALGAPPSTCDRAKYWDAIPSNATGLDLATRVRDLIHPHNVIPYTSSSTDVWDAFLAIDGNGTGINDIYAEAYFPVSQQGLSKGYNREHVWCRSRGVGDSGPSYSDLHHLFPADSVINSVRGNKYFGDCSEAQCRVPANVRGPHTGDTDNFFQPPPAYLGEISRALFYMSLRYRGDEPQTSALVLTDDTTLLDKDTVGTVGYMGLLHNLLAWNKEFPVTAAEIERNNKVCEEYQQNRNPFVDHPEWVDEIPWDKLTEGEHLNRLESVVAV